MYLLPFCVINALTAYAIYMLLATQPDQTNYMPNTVARVRGCDRNRLDGRKGQARIRLVEILERFGAVNGSHYCRKLNKYVTFILFSFFLFIHVCFLKRNKFVHSLSFHTQI